MAAKSPAKKKRAANKAARQKRRDEIVARWETRAYLREWEQAFVESAADCVRVDDLLQTSLVYTQDLSPSDRRRFLSQLDADMALELLSFSVRTIWLKEMPYDEYLQTPEWKARSARIKEAWGGKCALDERHQASDCHHRSYAHRGRELKDELIPLCRECHARFHGR